MTAGRAGRDLERVTSGAELHWRGTCLEAGCPWRHPLANELGTGKDAALRAARRHLVDAPTHTAELTARVYQLVHGPEDGTR